MSFTPLWKIIKMVKICAKKWRKALFTGSYKTRSMESFISQWDKTWKKFQFQMCVWMVARLPPRLKATFFEIFSSLRVPSTRKKISKMLILAFEANSAFSCQNGLFSAIQRIVSWDDGSPWKNERCAVWAALRRL